MANSPLLFGPNNTSTNLQNQILTANGTLLSYNGPKNYVSGCFEDGTVDGAALATLSSVVNGLPSGAPTFPASPGAAYSLTTTTANAISGTTSLLLASTGNFGSNIGFALPVFTIDKEDQAKVLSFKFSYQVLSGTVNLSGTSANSFGIAVYDALNAQWLGVAGCFNLTQGSGVGVATGTFQTAANGTTHQLYIYSNQGTTGATQIVFDNFFVGPQTQSQALNAVASRYHVGTAASTTAGNPINFDTVDFDLTASVTTGTTTWKYTALVSGVYQVETTVNLPVGAGLGLYKNAALYAFVGNLTTGSVATGTATVQLNAGDYIDLRATATGTPTAASGYTLAQTNWISISLVQAQGTDAGVRVVDFAGIITATQSLTASSTNVTFSTSKDSNAAWNGSTYTVPVAGDYLVSTAFSTTVAFSALVYVNGTQFAGFGYSGNANANSAGSILIPNLAPGALITIRANGTGTTNTGGTLSIFMLSGPNAGNPPLSVNATYGLTTAVSPAANSVIKYDTKINDSQNNFSISTGLFNCSVAGMYMVTTCSLTTSGTPGLYVYKNGAYYSALNSIAATGLVYAGAMSLRLNVGDTVGFAVTAAATMGAYSSSSPQGYGNQFSITRIGN